MNRVVHFEITADDMDRAERFYANVFGWSIRRWNGPTDHRLISMGASDTNGISGGLTPRSSGPACVPGGFVCTIEVTDLDEVERAVVKEGGQHFGHRRTLPSVGYLSYFSDTEGNLFAALQPDETAGAFRAHDAASQEESTRSPQAATHVPEAIAAAPPYEPTAVQLAPAQPAPDLGGTVIRPIAHETPGRFEPAGEERSYDDSPYAWPSTGIRLPVMREDDAAD